MRHDKFNPESSFFSFMHKPKKIQATEEQLVAIYDAAFNNLNGDALALASGFLPKDFAILCQSDPLAEIAIIKGKADNQNRVSRQLNMNALTGDTKAALAILNQQHGWVAAKPEGDNSNEIRIIVENSLPDPEMKK